MDEMMPYKKGSSQYVDESLKFGENIKKDHPDAEKLLSKLSNITASIEKIKDDLQFS